jgi:ankyrin repeat protein
LVKPEIDSFLRLRFIFFSGFLRHAAVSYGHQKLITALLAAGADINIEDVDGDTPLLVCEDPEVFELLLKNGADVKKTNNLGWGILEKVIDDDNDVMIKYLIEYGHVDNPEMLAQILSGISVKSIEEGDEEEDDDEKEETDGTAKMSRLN